MSIAGETPYYLLAHRREDGLIDFVLMNPRGWQAHEVKFVGHGARDEDQMKARVENRVPPWQESIAWEWVPADRIAQLANLR